MELINAAIEKAYHPYNADAIIESAKQILFSHMENIWMYPNKIYNESDAVLQYLSKKNVIAARQIPGRQTEYYYNKDMNFNKIL